MKSLLCLALIVTSFSIHALTGKSALDAKPVDIQAKDKGMVLVFLSARCPCSASHVDVLRKMAVANPEFQFVGVHSNSDEGQELTETYFKNADLGFPVVQDTGGKLANQYRANKTPHAFVLNAKGETVYRGGVTDSRNCEPSARNYLNEAISEVAKGEKIQVADARTLGCAISRGGKNDW